MPFREGRINNIPHKVIVAITSGCNQEVKHNFFFFFINKKNSCPGDRFPSRTQGVTNMCLMHLMRGSRLGEGKKIRAVHSFPCHQRRNGVLPGPEPFHLLLCDFFLTRAPKFATPKASLWWPLPRLFLVSPHPSRGAGNPSSTAPRCYPSIR